MASPALERSFSYGPDTYEDEDTHQRSVNQRRTTRSHSIVGSLWNLLYTRRQSLLEVGSAEQRLAEDDTDQADAECSKQDAALMQAYYNAVAIVVLLIAGCICWAVYCVLEPFLHPLLWAVLVGMILHPFKKTWTERISQWLDGLEGNSIPLSAGLVLSPLFLFNYLSKLLESAVVAYWGVMLSSVLGVASLWLLYKLSFPVHLYRGLTIAYSSLQSFDVVMSLTGPIQLVTVMVGFSLLLIITRSQVQLKYATALAILSTLVWFLAMLNVTAYVFGNTVALPLVSCLFVVGAAVSFATSIKSMLDTTNGKNSAELPKFGLEKKGGGHRCLGGHEMEAGGRGGGRLREESPSELKEVKCLGDQEPGELEAPAQSESDLSQTDRLGLHGPGDEVTRSRVSFGPITRLSPERVVGTLDEANGRGVEGMASRTPPQSQSALPQKESSTSDNFSQSDFVFLVLYILFFMTVFWTYPFLLILLVPFAIWSGLKRVVSHGLYENTFLWKLSPFFRSLRGWVGTRQSLLLPEPIPTLIRLYFLVDKNVLKIARGSVDSLMSAFIIFGLLVSGLALMVFLVLQIQVELSHYFTMMTAVWNRTLASNPQLAEWMGGDGSQSIQDTLGSFANQGYMYGREWLASQVQSLMGDSSEQHSAVEKQVLNLYDQLYQSYVLANTSTLDVGHAPEMADGDLFNELKIIVMDNLETVVSLLKSVWSILSDNLSLALSLLYTVLELLLSGGTALINAVVFLTTVFYLLCYSEEVYLPVKIVLDLLPNFIQSDTAGQYSASFSRAIRSVFHASMGRFLFYGLYTWLVHTAFGLPVSILPAVLAAIAGALPFIGPYWIALPAVLELWLVEGQAVSAIAVLVLSLLPLFFIDSIIYGEVEGGHPYLTGLAVAGGIYFAGLEGALIGPILLCCLVFLHELFGELFTHTHDTSQ